MLSSKQVQKPIEYHDAVMERIVSGEAMQQFSPEEFFQTQYVIYSLLKDEMVFDQLLADNEAKHLLPALSHLARTTNIKDKNSVKYMIKTWEIACRLTFLVNKPPTLVNRAKFEAWYMFGRTAIHDMEDGWRGKLVTERIKIFKLEGAEKKRRKLLGIF